ncbi:hypothetical protein GCM10009544_30690 [Streptomyces stramineus]|uniref:RNA-binding protein n=1 Tax=Streptomyces stramineus TaxID=173861 RepID=A0ABP3JZZ7_9ACTN
MAQMIDDATWAAIKEHFPIDSHVDGIVETQRPFGFFVKFSDFPDAVAVVDAIAYLPHGAPVAPTAWPAPGNHVAAKVVDHSEHNRQIKLRVEKARSVEP